MSTTSFSLEGRTILLVGATGDVGGAMARGLAGHKATLVLAGRNPEKLSALALAYPGSLTLPLDWTSASSRDGLVAALPTLDGVVLAGGVDHIKPLRFETERDWDSVMSANLAGPSLLLRDLVKGRRLNPGASIVLMTSVLEAGGAAGHSLYAASKAGLAALGRCLALELASRSVRVNSVAAGLMKGAMADRSLAAIGEEAFSRHAARHPLGLGEPDDAAHAALFLLSPAARWITGTSLLVDGGYSLT